MLGFHKFKCVISGLVLAASLATLGTAFAARAVPEASAASSLPSIALAELPPQGQDVYAKIVQGATFAHEKDGSVFGNRERQLPVYKRGYYREYTVRTPGVRNRGARRLICGGVQQLPDVCYYTEDHYASFRKVVP
jgi:ribonuclease T1